MAYGKKEISYVDVDATGKPTPMSIVAWLVSCGVKQPAAQARIDAYRDAKRKADDMLSTLIMDMERLGAERGMLADDMALSPYMRFGNDNVVRFYGSRRGVKSDKPAANAMQNVAALLASLEPKSTLIAGKRNGKH